MIIPQEKKGMIIFALIAVIFLVCAIIAFQAGGPQGIEERFHSAMGSTAADHEEAAGSVAGFSLEGNALLYLLVISALVLVCIALYRKYRV